MNGLRPAVGPVLQPTLDELSRPGRGVTRVPHPPADALAGIPAEQLRAQPPALPEVDEPEAVRHFVNLSHLNYAVDTGFYPLGSCTMKWNPKINEWAARLPGFADLHPLAPDAAAQGTLQLLWETRAVAVRDLRDAGGHAPAGRRGAGRADRHPDGAGLPPQPRRRRAHARSSCPTRRTAPTPRRRPWPATAP